MGRDDELPWRGDMLGKKAFLLDVNRYVWHNGYEWVDLDIQGDLDSDGAVSCDSFDDLPT